MKLSATDAMIELVRSRCQRRLDGLAVEVRPFGDELGVMVREKPDSFPRYLVTGLACDARADPEGFADSVVDELMLFLMKLSPP